MPALLTQCLLGRAAVPRREQHGPSRGNMDDLQSTLRHKARMDFFILNAFEMFPKHSEHFLNAHNK